MLPGDEGRILNESFGLKRRPIERTAALGVTGKQGIDPATQFRISGARLVEKRGSFRRVGAIEGFGEEFEFAHGRLLRGGSSHPMRNPPTNRAVNSEKYFYPTERSAASQARA